MLLHNRRKIYEVYILGALGGGFIEYVLSFLAEKILGAVFWDYSNPYNAFLGIVMRGGGVRNISSAR